jgi:hypothetical protein
VGPRSDMMWTEMLPGLILAGQRTIAGTRNAPSQSVFLSSRNSLLAAASLPEQVSVEG